jgi:uncharacterized protein (UPF0264 family)
MIGFPATAPRFLASVRTAEEACIALAGGADIIDAKEPRAGALGAVPHEVLLAIVAAVNGARPVSATIGDCPVGEAAARAYATAETGVDFVKLGLFDVPSRDAFSALARCAGDGIRLIAVMFADLHPDFALIPCLADAGFAGVMLDTAEKGRGLRAHLADAALVEFLQRARKYQLLAGLAGSLKPADARALLPLAPDVLGFRGALCHDGARGEALAPERVTAMRNLIGAGANPHLAAGAA